MGEEASARWRAGRKAAMTIDAKSFFLLAGTLAAGGAGGYYFRERTAPPPKPVEPLPAPPVAASAAPSAAPAPTPDPVPAAPPCDDGAGEPEACPVAIAPSDEGVCANWAAKRCPDYKAAFKPKVAQAAVACLRKLVGGERCDQYRANLCGHKALMAACQEPAPDSRAASADSGASSQLATQCEAIVKGCSNTVPETTLADCHRTLSGMNEAGRAAMVECMKTHCTDKGLFGCEAVTKATPRQ
jgi:hypothetical protein